MAESDTERVTVRTSIPRYQLDEWTEHADDLDMSRSEFIRTMVQAGRRGFDSDVVAGPDATVEEGATESTDAIRKRLLATLADAEYLSWDELRDGTVEDVEATIEEELHTLIAEDRVEHSPRNGGYRLVE